MLPRAMLLLGPTGVGKSPLGDALVHHGLLASACHHFDFGAHLRAAAADHDEGLSADQRCTVRDVLARGALLEDHQFPIAAALLQGFINRHRRGISDWIVLNGLPRHVGQATAIVSIVDVQAVVVLDAGVEVIHQRIAANTGGDRAGRADDQPDAIAARLAIYHQRTAPLIDHYAAAGARIIRLDVGVTTAPMSLQMMIVTELVSNSGRLRSRL